MTTIVKFLLILLLSFFSFMGFAHVSEEKAIEQAATDYMESYYKSDQAQMERAIHSEVAKRHIENRERFQLVENTGYSELVSLTKPKGRKWAKRPGEPLKVTVEILDVDGNIASIKASTDQYNFYNYIHLAKIDDQWKIVNVLWDNRKAE